MAFKNLRLGSDTSRLILLFVAILPATESKDWLFYTVSVLIIGLFIMHVIYAIQLYRKEKSFLCITGNLRSELIDLMVDIAGLMVAYSIRYGKRIYDISEVINPFSILYLLDTFPLFIFIYSLLEGFFFFSAVEMEYQCFGNLFSTVFQSGFSGFIFYYIDSIV